MWWDKPPDVVCPVAVHLHHPSEEDLRPYLAVPFTSPSQHFMCHAHRKNYMMLIGLILTYYLVGFSVLHDPLIFDRLKKSGFGESMLLPLSSLLPVDRIVV